MAATTTAKKPAAKKPAARKTAAKPAAKKPTSARTQAKATATSAKTTAKKAEAEAQSTLETYAEKALLVPVGLALEVRDADPSWAAKAVTLAAAVLDEAVRERDHEKVGGGQR